MIQQPASQAPPIPEAQAAKDRLAHTFGTPPPESPLRSLTDEDKAAVAHVAETTTSIGQSPSGQTDEQVASAAAGLRAMTSDLRKTDPEAAEVIENQAQKLEELG